MSSVASDEEVDILVDEATKQEDEVPHPEKNCSLPLRFRFYDEDEIEPEEDELELECERLFHEMESHATPTDHNPEIDAETICSNQGQLHDTYLDEEIGLICNRCHKVVTEIRDM